MDVVAPSLFAVYTLLARTVVDPITKFLAVSNVIPDAAVIKTSFISLPVKAVFNVPVESHEATAFVNIGAGTTVEPTTNSVVKSNITEEVAAITIDVVPPEFTAVFN